jgi:tetratricopeptide (TPR) repeat protein
MQFNRVKEILAGGEADKRYAYDLLVSCCTLDPANTVYRQELRRVANMVRRRQGLSSPGARNRLLAAKQAGDHRKVLEHGEAALAESPDDMMAHLAMAEAAAALRLPQLEVWLLEQARKQDPASAEPLRLLADAYRRQKALGKAIAVWQAVRKLVPNDAEAARQLNALLRLLARACERRNDRNGAIAVWQALLKVRPNDSEALRQIKALSANHITPPPSV